MGCTVLHDGVFLRLVRLIEWGDIKPPLGRSVALESLSEAQAFFLDKQSTGKSVIAMAL